MNGSQIVPVFFLPRTDWFSVGSLGYKDVLNNARLYTGKGLFGFTSSGFAQYFGPIVCVRVKKPSNKSWIASRHIKRKLKASHSAIRAWLRQRLCFSSLVVNFNFKRRMIVLRSLSILVCFPRVAMTTFIALSSGRNCSKAGQHYPLDKSLSSG